MLDLRLILLVLSLVWLQACAFSRPDELNMITPKQLQTKLQQEDILLVDVHIPEQTHLPGTDTFIPFYRVDNEPDKFPINKNEPIYLYCKSGPMANWAAHSLLEMGYTNIYNLEGGLDAWKEQKLPLTEE